GRRLGRADRTPPTCRPDETVAVVAERLSRLGRDACVVVGPEQIVCGRLRVGHLDATDTRPVEAVMEPGPGTVRADADLEETLARMERRRVTSLLITTPEGTLLGELRR